MNNKLIHCTSLYVILHSLYCTVLYWLVGRLLIYFLCDINIMSNDFEFPVVQPHPSTIRQWLRGGEVDKLEDVILHGQGHKLLGEYSSDLKVRAFLKTVPAYLVSASRFLTNDYRFIWYHPIIKIGPTVMEYKTVSEIP